MSNSNFMNSYLAYVAESTPGTTPGSPTMLKLRTPDPLQLNYNVEQLTTQESYSHRQMVMQRPGFAVPAGNIPIELSYGAFDDWLESLLGGAWSTETAGTPEVLKIGNAINTFTVERGNADNSQYERFLGVIPNSLSLDINPNGIVTGSFGVLGMSIGATAGSALGSPSNVATNEPFDGLGNASLEEGGSSIATVTSLQLNINNNRSGGRLAGSNGADVPVNGQIEVSGTLVARFDSLTLLNKFLNGTESSLQVVLNDEGGSESLTFDFHSVKYTGGQQANNENALDISLPFMALYDSGESTALTVTRSNAA